MSNQKMKHLTELIESIKAEIELAETPKGYLAKTVLNSIKNKIE